MISLLVAVGVAVFVALLGTPRVMRYFRNHGIGQPIREDGPEGHHSKAGTPTMGGLMIVAGTLAGYAVAHFVRKETIFTRGGLLVLMLVVGGALVGGLDDYIKVTRERSLGLNKRAKSAALLILALAFAWLGHVAAKLPVEVTLTRTEGFGVTLPTWVWVVFVVLFIVGSTNAVNLTDGLDGLAAGSAGFAASAFVVIGFWQFRHVPVYEIPQALDLAILAAALMGGCIGFLWWNAAPARIIMGDTGALAIGAGLAGLSLATGTPLLLAVVGGLFVAETLSVIVQVIAFRVFHRRLFKMAPFHHHFEQLEPAWPETTIIIRFWIIAGALTAGGLGFFYYDYLRECPGTPGSRNCSITVPPESAPASPIAEVPAP